MDLSAVALGEAFRSGRLTPLDAVEHCLARIEAHEGALGAWQAIYADEARQAADAAGKAIRAGHRIGPLHGIPFGLKDLFDIEGRETCWGSAMLKGRIGGPTGLLARRLIAAGAVMVGKTKTVECAFGGWGTNEVMGTPRNPWDMTNRHRVPGGSSSGSAVAVAAGMASFAVGSDTGGSIRLPATFCGIVGLKVTEGVLPLDGAMPLAHTLDSPGPMTLTVRDAALVYEAMLGTGPGETERDMAAPAGRFAGLWRGVRGLRFGTLAPAERETVDGDILALYDDAVERLVAMGAECVTFLPPVPHQVLSDRNALIIGAEAYANHGERFSDPANPADEVVRARVMGGAKVSAAEYIRTLLDRKVQQAAWAEAMAGIDALLTPGARTAAVPVEEADQSVSPGVFTRPYNYLGFCGISVPIGLTPEGLPAGLQILGRPHDEWLVMRIGAAVEAPEPLLPKL
jgi:aspartyl-tRNA(Asn)/glutamyl-tRNA(Gln) amidotransferase subunit A